MMKNLNEIISNVENSLTYSDVTFNVKDFYMNVPIFYSEDNIGNINFDIDSMKEQFDEIMFLLQKHNNETEYNWE